MHNKGQFTYTKINISIYPLNYFKDYDEIQHGRLPAKAVT